jgi:hypothetical protein
MERTTLHRKIRSYGIDTDKKAGKEDEAPTPAKPQA